MVIPWVLALAPVVVSADETCHHRTSAYHHWKATTLSHQYRICLGCLRHVFAFWSTVLLFVINFWSVFWPVFWTAINDISKYRPYPIINSNTFTVLWEGSFLRTNSYKNRWKSILILFVVHTFITGNPISVKRKSVVISMGFKRKNAKT